MADTDLESERERLVGFLGLLRASQYWSAERMARYQEDLLAKLLRHARDHVPFHRRRLEPLFRRRFGPHLHKWHELPVMTRREAAADPKLLMSTQVPPEHGEVIEIRSSGSTGIPLVSHYTAAVQSFWRALRIRDHEWHGRDQNLGLASIAHRAPAYPGATFADWGPASAALGFTGPAYSITSRTPVPKLARWLAERRPAYLSTYASLIAEIARHIRDHPEDRFKLQGITPAAEPVGEELRDLVREVWDLEVEERYGAAETGTMAGQCPDAPCLHVNSELALVEVIGDDGHPVAPDHIGRVVVTPLLNYASVFIRYEIGDYAVAGAPCGCGRTLPTLKAVLGRTRSLFRRADGTLVVPHLGHRAIAEVLPFRQFQFRQKSFEEIELRMVADRAPTVSEARAIEAIVQERFGAPVRVSVAVVEAIPRNPGGKYDDYLCEIADA